MSNQEIDGMQNRNGFYKWTKIMTPLMQIEGQKISVKIQNRNRGYFGVSEILF